MLDNKSELCNNAFILNKQAYDMSPNVKQKYLSAIAECERFIARESARADDLRPQEAADMLEWYQEHRRILIATVEAAEKESK